eukprot:COSAG06_NODE_47606_length_338_cov_0.648536_2_plen_77_part_01
MNSLDLRNANLSICGHHAMEEAHPESLAHAHTDATPALFAARGAVAAREHARLRQARGPRGRGDGSWWHRGQRAAWR